MTGVQFPAGAMMELTFILHRFQTVCGGSPSLLSNGYRVLLPRAKEGWGVKLIKPPSSAEDRKA